MICLPGKVTSKIFVTVKETPNLDMFENLNISSQALTIQYRGVFQVFWVTKNTILCCLLDLTFLTFGGPTIKSLLLRATQ